MILETIRSPADVKALDKRQLPALCAELRQFLVDRVSRTGGHLASNLGVVELTRPKTALCSTWGTSATCTKP